MNNKNEQKTVPSAIYQVREFQAMSTVFLTCVEETNYRKKKNTYGGDEDSRAKHNSIGRLRRVVKRPIVGFILHIKNTCVFLY